MTTLHTYLTIEPLPAHIATPILDDAGQIIAEWTSTNLRMTVDAAEVEEAVRWASQPDKYLEIRKAKP